MQRQKQSLLGNFFHGKNLYQRIKESKIEIRPSMIQPINEIKSLGKFKVKIYLHSEVDAEILINVESSETIQ